MAFPNSPILDDFSRANEDPLGNGTWGNLNTANGDTLSLVSGAVVVTPLAAVTAQAYWTPMYALYDCESYVTIAATAIANSAFALGRIQQPGGSNTWDGYGVQATISPSGLILNRYTNGSPTVLASEIPAVISNGDVIMLRCKGAIIEAYLNSGGSWSKRLSASDSTYDRGYIGIGITATGSATISLANFGGGNTESLGDDPPMGVSGRGAGW